MLFINAKVNLIALDLNHQPFALTRNLYLQTINYQAYYNLFVVKRLQIYGYVWRITENIL